MNLTKEDEGRLVHAIRILCIFTLNKSDVILKQVHLDKIQDVFYRICNDFDVKLIEFQGEQDYVKITFVYPPKISVSSFVRCIKSHSSRELAKEFKDLCVMEDGVLWKKGYFVISIEGASIDSVDNYIQAYRKRRAKK